MIFTQVINTIICVITIMNRFVSLTFVILVILTISLTVPHSFLPLGVEGQTLNNTV